MNAGTNALYLDVDVVSGGDVLLLLCGRWVTEQVRPASDGVGGKA